MAGVNDNFVIESVADTNIAEPWMSLAISAGKRFRGPMIVWLLTLGLPIMAIGVTVALIAPAYRAAASLQAVVVLYGALTYVAHTQLTRSVFVIRKEGERAIIDHQRWWRDDERAVPDSVKTWWPAQKRAVAWLYETEEDGRVVLKPFNPWARPIERKTDWVNAADIGGLKATMESAAKVASHRTPDGKEAVRVGVLAILVCVGLLAVYLAGNKAIDLFTGINP